MSAALQIEELCGRTYREPWLKWGLKDDERFESFVQHGLWSDANFKRKRWESNKAYMTRCRSIFMAEYLPIVKEQPELVWHQTSVTDYLDALIEKLDIRVAVNLLVLGLRWKLDLVSKAAHRPALDTDAETRAFLDRVILGGRKQIDEAFVKAMMPLTSTIFDREALFRVDDQDDVEHGTR